MSPYDQCGKAAGAALVQAAKVWPERIDIQAVLSSAVRTYEERKEAAKEVGSWFIDVEES